MVSVIIINKTGRIEQKTIRNFNIDELFKKCGHRKNNHFAKRATWKVSDFWISVFAKNNGRSNSINKYELPPPVDKDLFYGSIIAIKHSSKNPSNDNILNLNKDKWPNIYEKLFGGFEDLTVTSEEESEEDIPDELKTKEGYLKDGFVVDDDVIDDDFINQSNDEKNEDANVIYLSDDSDDDVVTGENDEFKGMSEDVDYDMSEEEDTDIDTDLGSELSEEEYTY